MTNVIGRLPILGPAEGFYPVKDSPEAEEQLWIPKGLQDYEALCLAQKVKSEYAATHIVAIARGGMATAQAFLYANQIKPVLGYQTDGYDEDNNPLPVPRIIARPDFSGLTKKERKEPMRLLITDELLDKGKALQVVKNDLLERLEPEEVKTAVIYVKSRNDQVTQADFFVRKVANMWLDHESQASEEHRNKRLMQLAPHHYEIQQAMGMLAMMPADINVLDEMLYATSQAYRTLHA